MDEYGKHRQQILDSTSISQLAGAASGLMMNLALDYNQLLALTAIASALRMALQQEEVLITPQTKSDGDHALH